MCGRFTLTRSDLSGLAGALGASFEADDAALYRPRYNIAPTDAHWIVRAKHEDRHVLPAKWGLVNSWAPDAKGAFKQINARSETAPTRPAFRDAFERRRCAVPADGFFEWAGAKDARRPIWFHPPGGELLLLAGLYESWLDPRSATKIRTFTILTTEANAIVAPVHDRMPVILPPDRVDEWLFVPAQDADEQATRVRELLRPAAEDVLVATEVSRRVNSVANDDAACLAPPAADEAPRLL